MQAWCAKRFEKFPTGKTSWPDSVSSASGENPWRAGFRASVRTSTGRSYSLRIQPVTSSSRSMTQCYLLFRCRSTQSSSLADSYPPPSPRCGLHVAAQKWYGIACCLRSLTDCCRLRCGSTLQPLSATRLHHKIALDCMGVAAGTLDRTDPVFASLVDEWTEHWGLHADRQADSCKVCQSLQAGIRDNGQRKKDSAVEASRKRTKLDQLNRDKSRHLLACPLSALRTAPPPLLSAVEDQATGLRKCSEFSCREGR